MNEKYKLRQHFRGLLTGQGAHDRAAKSQVIAQKLKRSPLYRQAATVLFYASLPHEVDTFGLIREAIDQGKRVCLPVVEKTKKLIIPVVINNLDELKPSTYGILEPVQNPPVRVDPAELGAIIVPGVAFDQRFYRLGQGAGYYDRFLSDLPSSIPTIGLGFDFQLIPCLPVDSHDVALSCVITN